MNNIKNIDVENKKVIVRVDYNVPIEDGKILDNSRIVASLETIKYLIDKNAKIILMSHLGKITKETDKEKNTLLPVKEELSKLLNMDIKFSKCLKGEELENIINELKPGEIVLLENTRYMDVPNILESNCDTELSKYWASLGEVFILDAFGSAHRMHASTYGISIYLPHAIGFLVEKEIENLDKIKNENKIILLGGAKVSDKIGVIKNLLDKTEYFLIGGAMCASFLKAKDIKVGTTFVDTEKLEELKELLKTNKIILPIDVVTENGIKKVSEINDDESILDIGPETIELFTSKLKEDTLILMNGTMGKYEELKYENGTKSIFEFLKTGNYKVVVCGGDTGSAKEKYNYDAYYTSTGGGASLKYLEGKVLEPLKIMETDYKENIEDKTEDLSSEVEEKKEEEKQETPKEEKLIVLNHKSYLGYEEIKKYKEEIKKINYNNLVLMPNIAYIELFNSSNITLGSQNFFSYNFGSYTGETSLEILKDLGVTYTLVGHPERLTLRLDTYEEIKEKLFKSVSSGFKTILCLAHDEKDKTLKKELKYYLKGIDLSSIKNLIIAYEPSEKIDSDYIDKDDILDKKYLIKTYCKKEFDINVPFLYGGGLTKENINEVLEVTDGVILGKISTNIEKLKEIIDNIK